MTYILRFTDIHACDIAASGGKGANLARLTQAGFPVPTGFVIAPAAYRDATASLAQRVAALHGLAHDHHAAIEQASAAIIADLRKVALPPALLADITEACAALDDNGLRWAVRSSGTAEDLAGAAFAGQHDTFLNCADAVDVVRRVIDCWCSLWSPRAIAYRTRLGFDHSEAAMAVVVQQMVNADAAGVAFSIDPVSGCLDSVVIDANFGLGESVVSGASDVDHLVVTREQWSIASRQVAAKTTRVVPTESGTKELEVGDHEAERAALNDEQAIAIAQLAARVEAHFGWPQDIEWAFANGELALLQSRPITTIPPRWTRDESAERFPNVITPLTWDFVEEGFHRSLNHSFALMGLPEYDGKWFASFGHYVYGNQNAVELYARRSPVPSLPLPELVRHLPVIIERFRWLLELPAQWRRDLPMFLGAVDAFLNEPLETYDLEELWHYVERVNAVGTQYFLPNIAISIGHGVLHRALRVIAGASLPSEQAEGLCSALVACETMTTRVNEGLRALASLARSENVESLLLPAASQVLWEEHAGTDSRFWNAFRQFLANHGHRETDFDAYHPTWGEAPWVVLDHLRALMNAPDSPVRQERPDQTVLEQAMLASLPEGLRGITTQVVALAREYTALDDLEHYHTTRLSHPLRRGVREIGRRLRVLGLVSDPMDAFFARRASLAEAISDRSKLTALRDEIAAAKAGYLQAHATAPKWTLGAVSATAPDEDAEHLAGIPGSPGAAEGVVHIVRGTDDFAAFPRGAVLVARTTNPAWTPLFYSASAIVTESGGALSHGAVTAREMRIPAVMAVRGVLARLRNGDRVRVDGATGLIEVLPAA